MNGRDAWFIFVRYIFLIILSIGNLSIFYFIFTPLTFYVSYFVLNIIYPQAVIFSPNLAVISIGEDFIQLVEACIAGAAYYFLLILNLSTPMGAKTRIKSILFLFASFFILNIIRIVVFAMLFVQGYTYFDLAHRAVWYFGSTLMLLVVWFVNVKVLNILSIPVYTDIKTIVDDIKSKRHGSGKARIKIPK
ncbi:MAG: pacearchaeosortase [Nanoarchaeota archaeon]|nr:pacearchaeosortase [Nanoarchaeota archaeon]